MTKRLHDGYSSCLESGSITRITETHDDGDDDQSSSDHEQDVGHPKKRRVLRESTSSASNASTASSLFEVACLINLCTHFTVFTSRPFN